jgi:hypothetical protein
MFQYMENEGEQEKYKFDTHIGMIYHLSLTRTETFNDRDCSSSR